MGEVTEAQKSYLICARSYRCDHHDVSDSCWSFMAQCGLLVLFVSEGQSRWSLRSRCQKHHIGWAENRRLIFWNCELLNGETEAVNPHPLKHKPWQLTRVQSFSDAWLLVLWLFHPVSFGEDLTRSILKRQAELAQMVYGVLWAQDKQWE